MSVLSLQDLKFWEKHGYLVIRQAVPAANCEAAAEAVWQHLDMNAKDPESWYPHPPRRNIMVEIYQHQALWNNRQLPKVHDAFAQIWGTRRLWVSLDRASMNPPLRDTYHYEGPFLHWDLDLTKPWPFGVQGVLYLTDTAANQGAFACIPGFHHKLQTWLKRLPADVDPRQAVRDAYAQQAVFVEGQAGDLIVWHSELPHGSSENTSNRPRIAQYISMSPARDDLDELRQERIQAWQERLTGLGQNQPGQEHHQGKTARLTPLGRKLLGLDRWEGEPPGDTASGELTDLERQMLGGSQPAQ
ncbi:MAG: phytanoyl-CoA dioxygenase family protein [Pirellulales bacterium]|jgi:hypothetical protein|nr:phytanoyl-CoA dioxygenase family protein [Pirellulales bacterium]